MKDIRKLPKYNVTATLQCAGNRRTAMSKTRTVKGVGWDVSAIGNDLWGGAKLSDVLELVGISKLTSTTKFGGKHVEFVSIDQCKEENGGPYKASIPLNQATNPEADVLLAYEMNGEPLTRDHRYPLRVVVPGVIGALSVKWLEAINIISEECQGFFMQKDYKMFPPSVNWENINWSTRRPQMDFPVLCVICSLEDMTTIRLGKIFHSTQVSKTTIFQMEVPLDAFPRFIFQERSTVAFMESDEADNLNNYVVMAKIYGIVSTMGLYQPRLADHTEKALFALRDTSGGDFFEEHMSLYPDDQWITDPYALDDE